MRVDKYVHYMSERSADLFVYFMFVLFRAPCKGKIVSTPSHSASPLIFGDGYNFELKKSVTCSANNNGNINIVTERSCTVDLLYNIIA